MNRLLLVTMVVSIFITSCMEQKPLATFDPAAPCDVILHPAMLSVPFDELAKGREDTEGWILTQFPTTTVKFESSRFSGDDNIGRFVWSEGNKGFSFQLDSVSRYIDQFEYSSQRPTLAHILRCYGDPEYYSLAIGVPIGGEAIGARLTLWYSKLGVIFQTTTQGFTAADRYIADTRLVGSITILPAGTVEEMLRNGNPLTERDIKERLALLRKWPENFTELPVDE